MLQITDEDKLFFKNVCGVKFDSAVKFINISLLHSDDAVVNLKTNNISFNYLVDNDCCIEVVAPGFQTNGNYRNVENMFSNVYTPSLNVGLVIDNIKDVDAMMFRLGKLLMTYATTKRMRLVIGQNIHVNYKTGSGLIYKNLPEGYITDVIFKYFRKLFI